MFMHFLKMLPIETCTNIKFCFNLKVLLLEMPKCLSITCDYGGEALINNCLLLS